ncbi:hypothetical protein G9A89_010367 [Geosiphon pyriformis]|nr:hypothetical protein G9A89_010367 [Geosiphon pyriformis]
MQVFTSGLKSGYLGASVVVIINFSLTKHVCNILEVPGWLLSIKLLFKNKLSVSILRLYAGASLAVWFSQAGNVNFLIAKTVNKSSFIIFGGNFNENSSHKCASFKKCLDLGLVNSLVNSPIVKEFTWTNSRDVIKTIDYVLVSPNLINVIMHCDVSETSVIQNIIDSGAGSDHIYSALFGVRKSYYTAKLAKFLRTKKANISTFDVLRGDNFLVLKDMTTQFPIFTIGLVIKDALKKDWKLWLVLQDIRKAYDSVGWKHLEKSLTELSFFFAAGTFINDTNWIGSNQSVTQHILNVASEFFQINNILINNDKMVIILINSRVSNSSLFISGLPISITKKSEFHQYLGIFFSTEGLLKPSLVKANLDVCFFTNLVLRKAISNKQLLYLVSIVFHLIVSYKTQFSFVFVNVCNKWNALIHKGLKLKSGLSLNFLSDTIHSIFLVIQFTTFLFMFKISTTFLNDVASSPTHFLVLSKVGPLNILDSSDFAFVCNHLSWIGFGSLSVYTDRSLKDLGMVGCKADTAAFFKNINLGLGVSVLGIILSTITELQAIVLALKCVLLSSSVHLFLDSQSSLDACKLELVKDHSGVSENEHANIIADATSLSGWHLPFYLDKCFIVANSGVVFGNSKHFVYNVYCSICHACWEVGFGSKFLTSNLLYKVNWLCSLLVWHPNLHMAAGFISRPLASACTYFIKVLYHWLLIAIQKHLYDKHYSSVLCLYYDNMEVLNYVFFCEVNDSIRHQILDSHMALWKAFFGFSHSSSSVLQLLLSCVSNFSVSMAFYKDFVFNSWFRKAVSIFHNSKIASSEIVKFVHSLGLAFRDDVWVVYAKYYAYIKKIGLILLNGSALVSISGLALGFSAGVIKLLGITKAFGVYFGFYKSCLFFLDISDSILVYIAA